jgi:hypothetical protein
MNETFTVAGAHGLTIENEQDFNYDPHGVWCGECGNSAGSVSIGEGKARYSCCMKACKNHDPRYHFAFGDDKIVEEKDVDLVKETPKLPPMKFKSIFPIRLTFWLRLDVDMATKEIFVEERCLLRPWKWVKSAKLDTEHHVHLWKGNQWVKEPIKK